MITPHPDDETFGAGGVIAAASAAGVPVTIVAVTDGEAASPRMDLAAVRAAEQQCAAKALTCSAAGAGAVEVVRLGLRDGSIAADAEQLTERLSAVITGDDLVIATYELDGHPDHEAVGAAARRAARTVGAELWLHAVWAWHWHDPRCSVLSAAGFRVELDAASHSAKQDAIACYVSQIAGADVVVPAEMVARFQRPFEVFIAAGSSRAGFDR